MDTLNEDLDDSALMCMSLVQKRKVSGGLDRRKKKQIKLDSAENYGQDEGLEESISSYFGKDKIINTCPLCLKSFESDSNYAAHMKQCAKKRQLTPAQLLSALKLQKEHLEERKMLGLCRQIVPASRKVTAKRKKTDIADSDLGLALALSESLAGTGNVGCEEVAGPSRKRTKVVIKSVLTSTTIEERQRILTEKAAVILADKGVNLERKQFNCNYSMKNGHLKELTNQASHLWNMGENEENSYWYVNEIKQLVEEEKGESVPTSPQTEGIQEDYKDSWQMLPLNEYTDDESNEPMRLSTHSECKKSVETPPGSQKEFPRLNLPKEEISQDWRKMIDNEKLSDIQGKTKDFRTFYLHSLVLMARCPEILEKDYETIFQNFDKSTVMIFLEYLYCGTLNGLVKKEVKNLLDLAVALNYENLIRILNGLEGESPETEGIIPSSVADEEIEIIEDKRETQFPDDGDSCGQDLVDLTQSSHSPALEDGAKSSEGESNADKSYWSFIQHEKERERLEEMRRQEEEDEKTIISAEMEKIETSIKERDEMMQRISLEFEKEVADLSSKLDLAMCGRRESSDSATKDLDEEVFKKDDKTAYECIELSSDSDTRASRPEEEKVINSPKEVPSPVDFEYEVPCFDPYDNYNDFSPGNYNAQSQSLISGRVSPCSLNTTKGSLHEELNGGRKSPEYCSTPVINRKTPRMTSTGKKSIEKIRKRRTDLSSSRIIRKSLGLEHKMRTNSAKKKKVRRTGEKEITKIIRKSILNGLSNSPLMKLATPLRNNMVEMTPDPREVFTESVTPMPDFNNMEEALLKEHLSKYGIKKSLSKGKAKKILQHIYDELHPMQNIKTGKIVKALPGETPKGRKKSKAKTTQVGKNVRGRKTQPNNRISTQAKKVNSSKESDQMSLTSMGSLDGSMDSDLGVNEFEDLEEPLTQSVPNNPVDLPSAFGDFLELNPEFHQKILLYEPIWLEELQRKLKETFGKHFKLVDLKDYLDQMCITFRVEAQKRNNERRNEKKKKKKKPSLD